MSDPLQASGARALTGIAFLVTATACFAVLDTTVVRIPLQDADVHDLAGLDALGPVLLAGV